MNNQDTHLKEMQDTADKHAKYLKLAFLAAIVELRNTLSDEDIEYALSTKNIDTILQSINIDNLDNLLFGIGMPKDTFIFNDEMRDIFNVGAMAAFWNLSEDKQKLWSYDPIGERAVAFLREDSARAAREIVLSTKAGVQANIARIMAETTDIKAQVKEIRQLIGLTDNQVQAVLNFKRQLETRQVLGLTPPDERRLSIAEQTLIRQHMKNGILSEVQLNHLVDRYYESMLNKRALDIAGTESMNMINNGQQILWEQGLDQGVFNDNAERKFWVTAGDEKVRSTHRVIPGMNPNGVKIRSMFITPFGLVYGPGDRNPGLINCRCITVLMSI